MCEGTFVSIDSIIDLLYGFSTAKYTPQRSQGSNQTGIVSIALTTRELEIDSKSNSSSAIPGKLETKSRAMSSADRNVGGEGEGIVRNCDGEDRRGDLVAAEEGREGRGDGDEGGAAEEVKKDQQDPSASRAEAAEQIRLILEEAITAAIQFRKHGGEFQSGEAVDGSATPSRSSQEQGELEERLQTTPKGEEHRIPEATECPPAPRKLPKPLSSSMASSSSSSKAWVCSSSSSRKRSSQQAFFVPPDSEVFSRRLRQDHDRDQDREGSEREEENSKDVNTKNTD